MMKAMKKIFGLCVTVFMLTLVTAQAEVGTDKYMHASACAAIGTVSAGIITEIKPEISPLKRALLSFGTSMLVGLGKELMDDRFDTEDLMADTLGAAVSLSYTWSW